MNRSEERRLLRAFLEDAEELLEKLNHCLLELEKDSANLEIVHEIFRLTHSLKSESALVGFTNLSELAHRLEDVFERLRSGAVLLRKELLDAILAAADLLQEMVGRIAGGEGDDGVEFRSSLDNLARLAGLAPRSGPPAAAPREAVVEVRARLPLSALARFRAQEALERGETLYQLTFRAEGEALMRYPRAYLVFSNLEKAANVLFSSPDLALPPAEDQDYSEVAVFFSSELAERELEKAFRVADIAEARLTRLSEEGLGYAGLQPAAEEASGPAAEAAASRPEPSLAVRGALERASVRVDTQKLDVLWQLVGELVTCKARFTRLAGLWGRNVGELRPDLERIHDSLDRVTAGMQQAIMETRMVPIAVLFNKFPRLVRDLSRKLGKNVELELAGQQTEIDRSLVEALSDPLTHLIRNSLDHGIEAVEDRLARGKPAAGRVAISAQQRGGKIVLEVADDGRGLDLDRIRQVAQAPLETTDAELINLIFQPGFSTRADVTELSGRGVGMDVVATRIKENLRGEVLVASQAGRGLTITILLPLTLTILHSLVVACGGHHYAIPILDIEETVHLPLEEPGTGYPGGELFVAHDGQSIQTVRLGELLGISSSDPGAEQAYAHGVVTCRKGRRYCLLVDELVEELDLVIKPIAEVLNPRRLFSGVSVLGDGRIVFILDTARIVELPE